MVALSFVVGAASNVTISASNNATLCLLLCNSNSPAISSLAVSGNLSALNTTLHALQLLPRAHFYGSGIVNVTLYVADVHRTHVTVVTVTPTPLLLNAPALLTALAGSNTTLPITLSAGGTTSVAAFCWWSICAV